MAKKIYEACRRLLTICGNCQPEENILIVTDTDSLEDRYGTLGCGRGIPKQDDGYDGTKKDAWRGAD